MIAPPIEVALCLLLVHAGLGAFDTFYNHEWQERLPARPFAAGELALHSARSCLFAVTFAGVAWLQWHGSWSWVLLALVGIEYLVTIADSVREDQTRRLSAIERANHMLLALNTGLYTAFLAIQVFADWCFRPTGLVVVGYGWKSWLLTLCSVAVAAWAIRDGAAARRMSRASALANG